MREDTETMDNIMNATDNVAPSVIHSSGKFYQAYRADGRLFFGTKEKAEAFARGEYNPEPKRLFPE